jgi:hypothetical protein
MLPSLRFSGKLELPLHFRLQRVTSGVSVCPAAAQSIVSNVASPHTHTAVAAAFNVVKGIIINPVVDVFGSALNAA